MDGLIGKTIGNYEIVEQLGRGAMAVVYKAYQKPLKRYVAIKILHPGVAADETFVTRFRREARSIAKLRHPHIVLVHDFGSEEELYYLVIEYVEGPSLRRRLEALRENQERMPHAEVGRVLRDVAAALDYAHAQDIIHRDVKPGNILLTAEPGGRAILTDFGLIRLLGMTSVTGSGILGTPEYLSPEQGEGKEIDARSDLYSLGIVLYEMLTGHTPFEGETPLNMILKHVRGEVPSPRTWDPDLPVPIERVVLKAIAHSPQERYASAGDLVAAFTQATSGVSSSPSKTPSRLSPPGPRRDDPATPRHPYPRGRLQPISREELRRAASVPPESAPESSATSTAEWYLRMVQGERPGRSIPLTGRITLGRASSNIVPLPGVRISRRHALIEVHEGQVRLTDLNSTNGTYVNGRRVTTTLLREGDRVQMGEVTLLVQRR